MINLPSFSPDETPAAGASSQFVLEVTENFPGTSLNMSNWWDPFDGSAGNDGIGIRDASLVTVNNELRIAATGADTTATSGTDQFRTAGLWMGPWSQIHGRWEFSARMEVGVGYGPALMDWPTAEGWPDTIEVDICEMPEGDRTHCHETIHKVGNATIENTPTFDGSVFHTYALEWTPTRLDMFLDGVRTWHITDTSFIPTVEHVLALQVDGGGNGFIDSPTPSSPHKCTLHVAYVKVWKYVGP